MEKVIHIYSADVRTCNSRIKTSKRYININLFMECSRVLGEVLFQSFQIPFFFFFNDAAGEIVLSMIQMVVVAAVATLLNLPCLGSFCFI